MGEKSEKMLDPCTSWFPPPRSSEVSIPISTASSLRTSNGCNWLLQKFILRKQRRGQPRREPRRTGNGGGNEILEAAVPPLRLAGKESRGWRAWERVRAG